MGVFLSHLISPRLTSSQLTSFRLKWVRCYWSQPRRTGSCAVKRFGSEVSWKCSVVSSFYHNVSSWSMYEFSPCQTECKFTGPDHSADSWMLMNSFSLAVDWNTCVLRDGRMFTFICLSGGRHASHCVSCPVDVTISTRAEPFLTSRILILTYWLTALRLSQCHSYLTTIIVRGIKYCSV